MQSYYGYRVTPDLYDETKINVSTSGCGCCSETIAGCDLDDDLEIVYRADVAALKRAYKETAETLRVLDELIRTHSEV